MFWKTKKQLKFFEVLARCEVWYWSRNIYLKPRHYRKWRYLLPSDSHAAKVWVRAVWEWVGGGVGYCSGHHPALSLPPYKIIHHELKAKSRSILAPVCLGVFSSGQHWVKEIIDWKQMNSQLLCSPCGEFRHNVRRCHHQTTDLGRQITRTTFEFQVADPHSRVQRQQTSHDSCAVLGHTTSPADS